MNSIYHFIIKPLDKRYENIKSVGDKELIINSSIENHIFVSKKAVVVSTPAAYKTKIKAGDEVYIHHNILRRYYDVRGVEKNSGTFFKDNLYFCAPEQIYMYNTKSHLDYCFIKPIKNQSFLVAAAFLSLSAVISSPESTIASFATLISSSTATCPARIIFFFVSFIFIFNYNII